MPFYRMPDGEALFVREFGQGEPVVVLSGLGMHSWQWLPFLYQHKKQYRFIIPDWRGFGGSNLCAVPELDAISSHWQDLNSSSFQQQNLQQFKLIGYSMGATTAMHGMRYGQLATYLSSYLQIDQAPKIWSRSKLLNFYGLFGNQHQQFKQLLIHLSEFLHDHAQYTDIQQMDVLQRKNLVELWLKFIELQASNKISPFLFKLAVKRPATLYFTYATPRLFTLVYRQLFTPSGRLSRGSDSAELPDSLFYRCAIDLVCGRRTTPSSRSHAKCETSHISPIWAYPVTDRTPEV